MGGYVFDSFALFSLLQREPGMARVQELLDEAKRGKHRVFMTAVNLGEVFYGMQKRRGPKRTEELWPALLDLPIQPVEVDMDLALSAARLKATTGVGHADCFAAALAQRLDAPVVTGDPDFRLVEHLVPVEWLPPDEG